MPSSDLQDELSATILRMATKRFRKRKRTWDAARPSVEDAEGRRPPSVSGLESSPAGSRATSANPPSGQDSQGPGDGYGPVASAQTKARGSQGHDYEPVASADDQLSYKLLEPSARHILSQLDATLRILHQTRALGPGGYDSDSSTADDQESDNTQQDTPKQKRPRGRPRGEGGGEQRSNSNRRGRPRRTPVPLEGESHKDMLIRIARDGHRRLPARPKSANFESGQSVKQETEPDDAQSGGPDDDFEAWFRQGTTRRGAKVWGLRDWSDVIGAASLAGFSPDVIARAARRCADLFGEGMTIRNLHEVPASAGTGVRTVDYRPEPIQLSASDADTEKPLSSSDDDGREASLLLHRRIASRQSSQAPSSPHCSPSPSPSVSHSRSRSRSASAGQQYFCPVPTCTRAANGFTRRANLARHMKLVHGGMTPDDGSVAGGGTGASEVDSEDEVLGAVHVDGFLRAVVPSRGWRGEDMMTRRRKKFWGERKIRGRDDGSDEGSRDGDVSS